MISLANSQSNFKLLENFHLKLTVSLRYLSKFKILNNMTERLLIPSKLISFTWNLTKLYNI